MNTPQKEIDSDDPWQYAAHERPKTRPEISDVDYPHYADLNKFIKGFATEEVLTILDYGAGASPYRKYFPHADYRRADITGSSSLQHQIREDSTVPEVDGTFDLILSTQVAEHVPNPGVYFRECFRLLRKGGRLVVTTHGIWEEHGSPFDFQRWTPHGLDRDLRAAGFEQIKTFKLSCGLRAVLLFFSRTLFAATLPSGASRMAIFKTFRFVYSRSFPFLYKIAEDWWPGSTVVEVQKGTAEPVWYIGLAGVANK